MTPIETRGDGMIEHQEDKGVLSRLVGRWQGTLLHRVAANQPFQQLEGASENRWVLGGRFVELALRAGDSWSAVFYIGHEHGERRHVLLSLESHDRRVATRRGDWAPDRDRLVLTSLRSRAVCDLTTPGELRLELAEEWTRGQEFVRFRAEYRKAVPAAIVAPPRRPLRRFVIA
jgi:hypothetical protein